MSSNPPQATNTSILPALQHALSGAGGTLISTCATYPLSLVTSRLQVQRQLAREGKLSAGDAYSGIGDALSRICAEEAGGARALYSGLGADAAKSVLDSFLFFLFYEWLRARRAAAHRRKGSAGMGALEELGVGMVAGACSRALTTPMANVVMRKQTAALVGSEDGDGDDDDDGGKGSRRGGGRSMWEVVQAIRKEKGILGLWSGYSASLVLTLNPSITFYLQDLFKKSLLDESRWEDPGPQLTFLLAALSKAVASSITYPFQTAKARLQVSAKAPSATTTTTTSADDDDVVAASDTAKSGKGSSSASPSSDIHEQVEAKLRATRALLRGVARRSIFGTIAQIVRTEGVAALYAGIQGEILKGFFNHGTTMLAKSVVHKLLFRLYLLVAGLLAELRARGSGAAARAVGGGLKTEGGLVRRVEEIPGALKSTAGNLSSLVRSGVGATRRVVLNVADGKPGSLNE